MVTGILIFGALNVALGFGLAVYLHRAPLPYADRPIVLSVGPLEIEPLGDEQIAVEPGQVHTPAAPNPVIGEKFEVEQAPTAQASAATPPIDQPPDQPPDQTPTNAPIQEVVTATPTIDVAEEIPKQWFDVLENVVQCRSFVEASVQVLQLEVGRYRGQLIEIDERIRANLDQPSSQAVPVILADLRRVNQEWLARQAEAAGQLVSRKESLGKFAPLAARLESILLHQAAQIETTCNNINFLDLESDVVAGHKRLIFELCKLLDVAHGLRDRMHESLVAIMTVEGRLAELDPQLQADTLTGVLNRTGLEGVLHGWWRANATHKRLASLALIDVDRFARCNESYGAQAGDGLIAAVSHLVNSALRKNRGYDVVARYDGQRLAVFAGDTGPWNTANVVERLRQTIDASTFELDGQPLTLTISAGVTAVLENDTSETLFDRVERALWQAKRSGRNQTCLEEGNGPLPFEPPVIEVKGKLVKIAKDGAPVNH